MNEVEKKEIERLKKEIERLKDDRIKAYTEMNEACSRLQLEAIKVFSDRLDEKVKKYNYRDNIPFCMYEIVKSDLLKEYGIGEQLWDIKE